MLSATHALQQAQIDGPNVLLADDTREGATPCLAAVQARLDLLEAALDAPACTINVPHILVARRAQGGRGEQIDTLPLALLGPVRNNAEPMAGPTKPKVSGRGDNGRCMTRGDRRSCADVVSRGASFCARDIQMEAQVGHAARGTTVCYRSRDP